MVDLAHHPNSGSLHCRLKLNLKQQKRVSWTRPLHVCYNENKYFGGFVILILWITTACSLLGRHLLPPSSGWVTGHTAYITYPEVVCSIFHNVLWNILLPWRWMQYIPTFHLEDGGICFTFCHEDGGIIFNFLPLRWKLFVPQNISSHIPDCTSSHPRSHQYKNLRSHIIRQK